MGKKKSVTVDDADLLVGKLRKRHIESHDLFGESIEWNNDYIQANLKDELRPYQKETLAFFHDTQSNRKADVNFRHLLFNMATGAGKTMMMATAILYLYKEKNYQNFLFFVHTDGILKKTIDNLINKGASKYLFTPSIEINGKLIRIEKVENFPTNAQSNTIYLKMATIGKIHSDLNTPRENTLTYEDLKGTSVVMLADEAHHYNALTLDTKTDKKKANAWERTIQKILESNENNRLLEFTATIDLTNAELLNKYRDKVVQRYDLKKFMVDGYSKKVMLLQINQDDRTKMLDAVLLSQYRKLVANKHGISGFKPVILFKSNTINLSLAKHNEFNRLITNLTMDEIDTHLQDKQRLLIHKPTSIWHSVASLYNDLNLQDVLTGIKSDFNFLNIINANSAELLDESNAKILNTLEDANNPFRVVFAVAKLSEGWDVLNLFDIVRMSENASATSTKTNQEAQLIGRGARYFPFVYQDEKSFKRRFDNKSNELAVLEQLHYHTINETTYINNLHASFSQAHLVANMDGNEHILKVKVKESFKKSGVYDQGSLYLNRTRKINDDERNLESYSAKEVHLSYKITDENLLSEIKSSVQPYAAHSNVKVEELQLDKAYFRKAIQRLKFYQFDSLLQYFPKLKGIDDFIENQLGKVQIKVSIPTGIKLEQLPPKEKLFLLEKALTKIEGNIRRSYAKFIGTKTFYGVLIKDIIKDYDIRVDEGMQGATQNITEKNMTGKTWFVYDKALLNQLEHKMVEDFEGIILKLKEKYNDVYLIRNNERSSDFKLIEFGGVSGFMPDFILTLSDKEKNIFYQVILEPKGEPYYLQDKWKERMLEQMNDDDILIEETDNVRLIGVKFYRQFNDGTTDYTQEFFDDLSSKIYDGEPLLETKTALLKKQSSLF